jgi:hypothetical protein
LPVAVSVCMFILVGGIKRFIVQVGVDGVMERLKVDSDLRHRLKRSDLRSLKLIKLSTGADIVPINAHTAG